MLGLMQSQPLLISSLIDFAERHHGDVEIVSRRVEGDIHRYSWGQVANRARQVANALDGMNLLFSDRVATLAWNGRSTRACIPSRSPGSPIMRKTRSCVST